jgi:hypothetical protein
VGELAQVPVVALKTCPWVGVPVIVGGVRSTGADTVLASGATAATVAVCNEVAVAVPPALLAATVTSIASPTSDA